MKLLRNEIPGQGLMYSGDGYDLFTPEYLIKWGPPKGDIPVGAWALHSDRGRMWDLGTPFTSAQEALAHLSKALGEDVTLETVEEYAARRIRQGDNYA